MDNHLKLYLNSYIFKDIDPNILKKNPHCIEYFINNENIINCSHCLNHYVSKNLFNFNRIFEKEHFLEHKRTQKLINYNKKDNECDTKCLKNSYIYPIQKFKWEKNIDYEIDKIKKSKNFKEKDLKYIINEIPIIKSETVFPKPFTVVHWGQLKMFLNTLEFLIKKNKESFDEFNIIYPGSARGDNILLLCKMFPNTRWYLIDPNKFHKDLYNHKQVVEIKNEIFTDEMAKSYSIKLKEKYKVFISDIRFDNNDENIISDQKQNLHWFKLTDCEFAWLKFRCPYDSDFYDYYDGDIYIQPYAKPNSSEGRLLLSKNLVKKKYVVKEYVGKFYYFNRILRPSYYKSFIENHDLLDHCWDCTCFQYIIKNYVSNFKKFNFFKTDNIEKIVNEIIKFISMNTINRLKLKNDLILSRLNI